MKYAAMFGKTTRNVPKDEVTANAELLTRAGFVEKLMAGAYTYLPLGLKVLDNISAIVREEMDAIGGQELLMPMLHPSANWKTTGAWKTLDVLEHTEGTIHRVVRLRHEGAAPPRLKAERTEPNEVVLTYDSPRKLCAVARGIGRGVAKKMQELITIREPRCMHRGDPACVIIFRKESP